MSITAFVKEQAPKLSNFQLEAVHERISVRAVAGARVQQAAERSFPHVTLNDAMLEAIQNTPTVPQKEVVSSNVVSIDERRPLVDEAAISSEKGQNMADAARARIARIYGAPEASDAETIQEAA